MQTYGLTFLGTKPVFTKQSDVENSIPENGQFEDSYWVEISYVDNHACGMVSAAVARAMRPQMLGLIPT